MSSIWLKIYRSVVFGTTLMFSLITPFPISRTAGLMLLNCKRKVCGLCRIYRSAGFTILEYILDKSKSINSGEADDETGYSAESIIVHEAVSLANRNVHNSSEENAQYRGMGTTVVVVLFYDNRFTVAHVGDSRLYRLRDGELEQITRDHSLMQELIDRGFYTPEQARNSLNKNLVTRAVGIDNNVQIDIQEDIAMVDDIYLLCSDGVTDMIEDHLIKSAIIENSDDLEKAASEIIRLSNEHGGKDNISALLARPIKSFPAQNSLFSRFFDLFS